MLALRRQFWVVASAIRPRDGGVYEDVALIRRLPYTLPRRSLHDRDPYQLLGIAPTNDLAEIKRAFRTQALALHPDRVTNEQRAEALRQFHAVVKAFELLCRSDEDWRSRQEADFAQWLRDELEWARGRLRSQRARVLCTGQRDDMTFNVSSVSCRANALRSKERLNTRANHLRRSRRTAKVEALELEQEIEQELAWARARAAAARKQSGALPVQHEMAAAVRRLAQLGIDVDRV